MTNFSADEMSNRWHRIQALMDERGFDALLVSEHANYQYLTGHDSLQFLHKMRPMLGLLPAQGDPVLFIYSLEEALARADGYGGDIRTYLDVPFPVGELRDLMAERGVEAGVIGVETGANQRLGLPLEDFDALRASLPAVQWRNAGGLLADAMMIKSHAEIEMIRRACDLTQEAWHALMHRIKTGMTIREVEQQVALALIDAGADPLDPGFIMVRHMCERSSDRVFRDGDLLKLDFGARLGGYYADITRLASIGPATHRHRQIHADMYRMMQGCVERFGPGVSTRSIAEFNSEELVKEGYQPLAANKRIGHGVGLELTQPPSLNREDSTILGAGMVIAIEPRFDSEFGRIHLEELVAVNNDDADLLSQGAEVLGEILS